MKIVLFGPGPQFKGGISNYNTSLARALDKLGMEVHIVSWTQQYPAIIPRDYIDRSSKSDLLEGTRIRVTYITNYNNPFSWVKTVNFIKSLQPDKVIFQWAIALQGIPLGWITRKLMRWGQCEVIFDCHLVIQKENSNIDKRCSKYGLKKCHTYLTHAYKTVDELKQLYPHTKYFINETGERSRDKKTQTVIKLYHPIYDLYKPDPSFDVEAFKKAHGLREHVFLFFGFIRKYKGLHNAIRAFAKLAEKRDDVSLLIAGESFWNTLDEKKLSTRIKKALFGFAKSIFLKKADDEENYRPFELIDELGIKDKCMVVNRFVPNEEVHTFFQVSDAILLYYLYATPSGVESLSYNFNLPVLATSVGHFPETIKDGYNGYLAAANDTDDMAAVMERALTQPIDRNNVAESAGKMSWENYAKAITRA